MRWAYPLFFLGLVLLQKERKERNERKRKERERKEREREKRNERGKKEREERKTKQREIKETERGKKKERKNDIQIPNKSQVKKAIKADKLQEFRSISFSIAKPQTTTNNRSSV